MMYHLIRFIRNFEYLVSLCNYSRWDRSHPFVIFTIGHWLPRGFPMPLAWFHAYTYSPALIATLEVYPVQMWQHETFIHFGYITVDIIGCVDGKYEHNSADATCQDFAKIPLLSLSSVSLALSGTRPSRTASTTVVSSSRYAPLYPSLTLHWVMTSFPTEYYTSRSVFPAAD